MKKVLVALFVVLFSSWILAKELTFDELFEERLRPQLNLQIQEHFSEYRPEVTWVRFKLPNSIAQLKATLAKKIVLGPLKYEGKGVVVVQFEVSSVQYAFTAEYRLLSEVLVATRILNVSEKINESDVQFKKMDVTYLSDRAVKREEILGRSLNHTVQVGQIVQFSDLKREPLIDRGQSVKIQWSSNGLEISALGIAEQVGFMSDWIRVTNPETKKTIVGKVIERGTIEIQ
jgi:flagella basal body P-ring formation protein FlgA